MCFSYCFKRKGDRKDQIDIYRIRRRMFQQEEPDNMPKFIFEPFFRKMKEKRLSQSGLTGNSGFPISSMYRIRHDRNISLITLVRLMYLFDIVDLNDMIEIIDDD